MTKHLTVISYRSKLDRIFELIALASDQDKERQHQFVRCQHAGDLYECVSRSGGNITCLDLVGHGSSSRFRLGDDLIIQPGQWIHPEIQRLNSQLSDKAVIRLLGCFTGVDYNGKATLRAVSKLLNGREVLGTTTRIEPRHFGSTGLQDSYKHLTSSHENPIIFRSQVDWAIDADQADLAAGRKWESQFPGYRAAGRGWLLSEADFSVTLMGATITLSCDCQLLSIEDDSRLAPLILYWYHDSAVPLSTLLQQSTVHAN